MDNNKAQEYEQYIEERLKIYKDRIEKLEEAE